jgi:hypothetical protein
LSSQSQECADKPFLIEVRAIAGLDVHDVFDIVQSFVVKCFHCVGVNCGASMKKAVSPCEGPTASMGVPITFADWLEVNG